MTSKLLKSLNSTNSDDTVSFESDNSSIIMSAPLTQKYVCKDRLNITLHSPGSSIQTRLGYKSNLFTLDGRMLGASRTGSINSRDLIS
ncbi:unnamed protein product [Haemonchus placei]|uniref:Uncharacterized protein n=1 Tax=Haemonchus placei TaxID=6290 RepID=A0A3P7U1V8_HAEPC|nr:unnamed protein product [Haemonchus placei]